MTDSGVTTHKRHRSRGIYLLPNLFTIGAMFAGFYAIVAAMKGHYEAAAIAILIAVVMDGLDGRIARLLKAQSEFGVQLDSLSDMVSFGIAPALVLYTWSISIMGKPGWLAAFTYTACTALRLARFNVQAEKSDKRFFQGLATPMAAVLVASVVWACASYEIPGITLAVPMTFMTVLLGLLKVSTIRYRSFKDLNLRDKVPFVAVLLALLILVFISFDPPDILLVLSIIYVVSGPVGTLWTLRQRRRTKKNRRRKHTS